MKRDDEFRRMVGDRLRKLRMKQRSRHSTRQHHMSQVEVAAHVGVTQSSLSHYEAGVREVPLAVALRLGALYGVEVTDIASVRDLS